MNVVLIFLALSPQATQEAHRAVFEKAADSVVAIRAMATLGERSGSGVIVSKDGLILASYATCPEGVEDIRVFLRGPRLLMAKIVATSPAHELTLLKVQPKSDLVPIEFGDSAAVKVGDASYTLGNAANSIINNDSASLAAGIISALYTLRESRGLPVYVGPVFETTAAVNAGMEGSPLLDAKGRMVGFVTLNYSPSRFLGNAIPANLIRAAVNKMKTESPVAQPANPPEEARPGYLGLSVVDKNGRVEVESVDAGSPAARKGLSRGVILIALGGRTLKNAEEFRSLQKDLKEGDTIFLKIKDEGTVLDLQIPLARKGDR